MDFENTLKPYLSDEEISSLIQSFDGTSTHAVLLNTLKLDDKTFLKSHKNVKKHPFIKHAYVYDKEEYEIGKEIKYDQGLYSIQDPSAMMPVYFLNPQPNELILDLCAAPGGKSIQIALGMEESGILIANDISYPRAKDLSKNVERMGLGNVIVTSTDFSLAYTNFINTFDKILLDAPCSGSAMFRKNPLAKKDWNLRKVSQCAAEQKTLLDKAFKMLKPGGTLCYSTCSFSYEEDDGQILNFLKEHDDAEIIKLKKDKSFTYSSTLPEAIHLLPTHFEGEGQFICLLKKKGELKPTLFNKISNKKYSQIIEQYGLENRSNEIVSGCLYSLSNHFDISHLNVLRYGVNVMEINDRLNPHHNLSHYLNSSSSLELDEQQTKKYLHGDTFAIDSEDGYKIVSFDGHNIGFVKITNKVAKNHYPKGLRRLIN